MVAEFGKTVLSTPQTRGFDLLAWILPLGGTALGAVALAFGARYWSRSRTTSADDAGRSDELPPEDERRGDEELARFDA
jgi:cytochrome c-type biogenesis protein CcmH/NrfF